MARMSVPNTHTIPQAHMASPTAPFKSMLPTPITIIVMTTRPNMSIWKLACLAICRRDHDPLSLIATPTSGPNGPVNRALSPTMPAPTLEP